MAGAFNTAPKASKHPKENTDTDKKTGETKGKAETRGKDGRVREKKLKFTYQEQKDWEVIEDQIQQLEEEMERLDGQIEAAARDFVKLRELMEEKDEKEKLLEEKMERWMYLNELADRIAADR